VQRYFPAVEVPKKGEEMSVFRDDSAGLRVVPVPSLNFAYLLNVSYLCNNCSSDICVLAANVICRDDYCFNLSFTLTIFKTG
jgi:hypothetical protein